MNPKLFIICIPLVSLVVSAVAQPRKGGGKPPAPSYFSSCVFCLAWPLLAVPLFGLLRIRVTDEASKRAVNAFACRDEPMPLAVDCSPNMKRRNLLVLSLRLGQTPRSICWRSKFTLSSPRDYRRRWRCMLHIGVGIRRFRESWCDKRRRDERSGKSPLSELPRLLIYLALLAQSQNKRNESDCGVFDTRAQGPHEIPNTTSLLQQQALELSGGGAHR